MKNLKKIAALAASAAIFASQTVMAATYVAPMPTDMSKAENFEAVEFDKNGLMWYEKLGDTLEAFSWEDSTETKIADGSELDTGKQTGDKVLKTKIKQSKGIGILSRNNEIKLDRGDVVTCSFDYYEQDHTNTHKLEFYINNYYPEYMNKSSYDFQSTLSETRNAVNVSKLFSYQVGMYTIGAGEAAPVWMQKDGFVPYKVVINTADAAAGGKQTIEFYRDNSLVEKGIFYETGKNEPMTEFDGFCLYAEAVLAESTVAFDNISYKVEKAMNGYTETFDGCTQDSAGAMPYFAPFGNAVEAISWSVGNTKIVDGSTLSNSGKSAGDDVLQTTVKVGQGISFFSRAKDNNGRNGRVDAITLNKGDIFTYSFDYYESNHTNNHKVELLINGFRYEGATVTYNYKSLINPDSSASSSDTVMMYQQWGYNLCGGWINGMPQEDGFVRYSVVINTCDRDAGGKQTIAFYRGGNLIDKGTFYENGKSDPLTAINSVCLYVEGTADEPESTTVAFDNIWACKTTNSLEVDGPAISGERFIGGDIKVKYERTPVFEQENAEVFLAVVYNSDGKLIDCKIGNTVKGERITENNFCLAGGAVMKVFMWDGFDGIKPIMTKTFIGE